MTRPHGFSLIELAITLALVGVLALMVGPFTINWLVQSTSSEPRANWSRLTAWPGPSLCATDLG